MSTSTDPSNRVYRDIWILLQELGVPDSFVQDFERNGRVKISALNCNVVQLLRRYYGTRTVDQGMSLHENTAMQRKKKHPSKKSVIASQPNRSKSGSEAVRKPMKTSMQLPVDNSFPKWLTETVPKPFPYFPQIGDVVYYYQEAHEKYVNQLADDGVSSKLFKGMPKPHWNFMEVEKLEIVALKFVNVIVKLPAQGAPTIHHLAEIKVKRRLTPPNGRTFKISFHEMPDIEDFLVPEHHVLRCQTEMWQEGDRVRSLFWDKGELRWYKGTIDSVMPEAPGMYHMLKVRWDGSEDAEPISPWELYLITSEEDRSLEDGTIVTAAELRSMAYQPTPADWNNCDPATEMNSILEQLHTVSVLQDRNRSSPRLTWSAIRIT
ncbi:bromodomain and WD repeat-containing protein 3-like [Paramacrobiotus metropolitanus]|uniref:bromodomain and WD repeat-containing protein 3-like n=1 Tax=Paramacrobiotus metropolitanus TaxID=2943436 RepID=UPI002445857F|nr:bromodomain and WD repeat-containing protein 3-like [Paramacrobiotus metropolitanus]